MSSKFENLSNQDSEDKDRTKKNNLKVATQVMPWTKQEDELLIDLVAKHGTKWTVISRNFEGRGGVGLKNRFLAFVRQGRAPRPPDWHFHPRSKVHVAKPFRKKRHTNAWSSQSGTISTQCHDYDRDGDCDTQANLLCHDFAETQVEAHYRDDDDDEASASSTASLSRRFPPSDHLESDAPIRPHVFDAIYKVDDTQLGIEPTHVPRLHAQLSTTHHQIVLHRPHNRTLPALVPLLHDFSAGPRPSTPASLQSQIMTQSHRLLSATSTCQLPRLQDTLSTTRHNPQQQHRSASWPLDQQLYPLLPICPPTSLVDHYHHPQQNYCCPYAQPQLELNQPQPHQPQSSQPHLQCQQFQFDQQRRHDFSSPSRDGIRSGAMKPTGRAGIGGHLTGAQRIRDFLM